jgi:hypothetical protein
MEQALGTRPGKLLFYTYIAPSLPKAKQQPMHHTNPALAHPSDNALTELVDEQYTMMMTTAHDQQ